MKRNGTEFVYMTDLSITDKNIKESIYLGRKRWKIENEGFNIQKNGTFNIGHLYSKDATSIKIHYLMIQIAHIIRQILEKGIKEIKELGTHHMFIAEVLSIDADEKYIDENGAFDISKCDLISYQNGGYYTQGEKIGKFGFSVQKNQKMG